MGGNHLVDMSSRRPPEKDCRTNDCRRLKIQASAKRDQADYAETQAGKTDLKLKRAGLPANERGNHFRKKYMKKSSIDKYNPDAEEQEIGKNRVDYNFSVPQARLFQ